MSTSTELTTTSRTRLRRGVGVAVCCAALVTPLALASPASSAKKYNGVEYLVRMVDQAAIEGAGGPGCNGPEGGVGPAVTATVSDPVSNTLTGEPCASKALKAAIRKAQANARRARR